MSRVNRAHSLQLSPQERPLPSLPQPPTPTDHTDAHPLSSFVFNFRHGTKAEVAKADFPPPEPSPSNDQLHPPRLAKPRDSLILTETSQRRRYFMGHEKRGIALIINNKRFDRSLKLTDRLGTDVDALAVEEMFLNIGFERGNVHRYDDVSHRDMNRLMKHYSCDVNYENMDCFMCVILSHGKDGGVIYGYDGKTCLDLLLQPFKNNLHPTLIGKPKVFLIQACRGDQFDDGVLLQDAVEDDGPSLQRLPLEADFLYAYSTVPGYFSWRNAARGSWFIEALVKNMQKYRGDIEMDLVRLLTCVNYDVAYEYQSNVPLDNTMHLKKQMPSIVSMLTRELHF